MSYRKYRGWWLCPKCGYKNKNKDTRCKAYLDTQRYEIFPCNYRLKEK